jgi:hypothetical protein
MEAADTLSVGALPSPVRRFVEGHFDTVTAVEVLLLLHRESGHAWSSDAVARRLRLDGEQTRTIIDDLEDARLVRRRGHAVEYTPETQEVASAVEMLAAVYSRYRHRIISLIICKRHPPGDGLRSSDSSDSGAESDDG